jgi:hypothetical protein
MNFLKKTLCHFGFFSKNCVVLYTWPTLYTAMWQCCTSSKKQSAFFYLHPMCDCCLSTDNKVSPAAECTDAIVVPDQVTMHHAPQAEVI